MTQPITLYLIGFAGTGKYTIAKEFSAAGYKLVDNHLINNAIFSLLTLEAGTSIPEEAWEAIHKIRHAILEFVAQDWHNNYVLTNELLEEEIDHTIYNQVQKTAENRGSIFVPIKLLLSDIEHQKRITNPQRKERFKETYYPLERFKKGIITIYHPNLMTLDVTDLTPKESAERILAFVDKILGSHLT